MSPQFGDIAGHGRSYISLNVHAQKAACALMSLKTLMLSDRMVFYELVLDVPQIL